MVRGGATDGQSSENTSQRKRRRSVTRGPLDPSSPWAASSDGDIEGVDRPSSIPPSSLPASSPPGALSDLTDGEDVEEQSLHDEEDVAVLDDDDDDEGEDLFGDTMAAYVPVLTQ